MFYYHVLPKKTLRASNCIGICWVDGWYHAWPAFGDEKNRPGSPGMASWEIQRNHRMKLVVIVFNGNIIHNWPTCHCHVRLEFILKKQLRWHDFYLPNKLQYKRWFIVKIVRSEIPNVFWVENSLVWQMCCPSLDEPNGPMDSGIVQGGFSLSHGQELNHIM